MTSVLYVRVIYCFLFVFVHFLYLISGSLFENLNQSNEFLYSEKICCRHMSLNYVHLRPRLSVCKVIPLSYPLECDELLPTPKCCPPPPTQPSPNFSLGSPVWHHLQPRCRMGGIASKH